MRAWLSFCSTKHANLAPSGWLAVRYNGEQLLTVSSSHIVPQASCTRGGCIFNTSSKQLIDTARECLIGTILCGMLTPLKYILQAQARISPQPYWFPFYTHLMRIKIFQCEIFRLQWGLKFLNHIKKFLNALPRSRDTKVFRGRLFINIYT